MIPVVLLLAITVTVIKLLKLYKKMPLSYEEVLRKGLVLDIISMKTQAIDAYQQALYSMDLSLEEKNNIHYLCGLLLQSKGMEQAAIKHYDEAFRVEPDYLQYRKEYQTILNAYCHSETAQRERITILFKRHSADDIRFAKLTYPKVGR
ncbi:hypothetical protein [Kurthia sibirica]|uniref:Tetratricopeptide repeat protein n=1 Tax=Kurthia sibirica TaxID=202750 RepID=A0A2U3ANE9_9BACL|nr:hypothetical protein [Kurthia sibirica]PWI26057.1 hypothetical protein DEX24_05880 [Kurthia sibirica]GEK34792.1 hypothetical protein KSI01_23250 [Kurthia sibirica]